jgi:tetratricopeptide (TPR) repeat protein
MRAGIVWLVAAACGLTAFGATLVMRAPQLPRQRGGAGFRAAGGPGILPPPLETLESLALNSADVRSLYNLARRYEWTGRTADALRTWREVARASEAAIRPSDPPGRAALATLALGEAQRALGEGDYGEARFREAANLYTHWVAERGEDPVFFFRLGWCSYRLGDQGAMARYFDHLDELLTRADERPDLSGLYQLAAARSLRGYNGQAIAEIEKMESAGFTDFEMLRGAEEFANIRGDPEFRAILNRVSAAAKKAGQ